MSSIVTNEFRVHNAQSFIEDVKIYNYYMAIGKVDEWDTRDLKPLDTRRSQIYSWDTMIGGKKILAGRVSLVIPRIDWAAGTTYTMYDDTNGDLDSSAFYVITDELNVYKCLDNNNNAPSTVKPTGTNITTITLSDGYIWKFMYKVSLEDSNNFITRNFMPVKTLLDEDDSYQWPVQKNAVDGSIEAIGIVESGSGYQTTPEIAISGDGEGATAIALLIDGVVTKIQITNPGRGYTHAKIEFIGGDPLTPAQARAIMSPKGGHGSDPAMELFGRNVMLGATMSGSEDDQIPITNDFRIVTIIKEPMIQGDPEYTESFVIPTVFNALTRIEFAAEYAGEFNLDDLVTGRSSGATGRIVSFDSATNTVGLCNVDGNFEMDESLDTSSGGTAVVGKITPPDFVRGSGSVIYYDYRLPISRAIDQEENIRVTLEF